MAHTVEVKRVIVEVKTFPGLGRRIKNARESDPRSLSRICREAEISRGYWYQLENEELLSPATEEIIRKVESALGVNLQVTFERAGEGDQSATQTK